MEKTTLANPSPEVRLVGAAGVMAAWLFLKDHWRPADSLSLEVDTYLDAVGNPDEGNTTVHTEFLTVEGHCPLTPGKMWGRPSEKAPQTAQR